VTADSISEVKVVKERLEGILPKKWVTAQDSRYGITGGLREAEGKSEGVGTFRPIGRVDGTRPRKGGGPKIRLSVARGTDPLSKSSHYGSS